MSSYTILPNGKQQFIDSNGNPLAGGKVYYYIPSTTTFKNTYQDDAGSSLNTNPVVLDASGQCIAYGTGSYRQQVFDVNGNLIWDQQVDAPITSSSTFSSALVTYNEGGTGAVTTTVQTKLQESISVMDFIPAAQQAAIINGTSSLATYDCYSAFVAAITAALQTWGSSFYATNPKVYVPLGKYYLSSTIVLTNQVQLYGDTSGYGYTLGPTLIFPAGITGIYAHTTTGAGNYTGAGSIIQGLSLQGTAGSADAIGGHGIYSQTTILVRNVYIHDFVGNGITINADTSGSGYNYGNANGWSIKDVTVQNCYNGIYIHGGDANAGNGSAINVTSATNCGIYDSSFLGNTWLGCQVVSTGPAFKTDNPNARTLFVGCYAEGGAGLSSILAPSMVLGGILSTSGSFVDSTSAFIGNGIAGYGLISSVTFNAPTFTLGYSQPLTSGTGLSFPDTSGTYSWTFAKQTGSWGYQWAGGGTPGNPEHFSFYDRNATPANGYARDVSSASSPTASAGAVGIGQHYFGNNSQMLWRGLGTAAPTTGAYLQGDIIWNSTPASGGYIGWVCTAAGTPGTWKTFGLIS